jgi:hypothetical protein
VSPHLGHDAFVCGPQWQYHHHDDRPYVYMPGICLYSCGG